jgi:hypothetical protein
MSARRRKPERPGETGAVVPALSNEEIGRRAHEIYLARGGQPGHELEDWLRAERELVEEARRNEAHRGGS